MKKEKMTNGLFELTVKAVILNEEGKVLILKRSEDNPRCPRKMDLPGGGVNEGENIEDAIRREIREELDIEIEVGPIIYHIDWKKEETKENIFAKGIRLVAFHKSGEIKTSDEHESFEWMDIEKAISIFENSGFEKDKRDALIKTKKYLEFKKGEENWKRCVADFENYKKRQGEAQKEFREYAKEDMILQILPVIDNFHASTDHVPEEQKDNAWVTGIMHIQKQLEKVIEDNGAEEIGTKEGDKFNPEVHEAVSHEGKGERIKKVVQRGYRIGKRVIRAAKVIVN